VSWTGSTSRTLSFLVPNVSSWHAKDFPLKYVVQSVITKTEPQPRPGKLENRINAAILPILQ